MISRGGEVGKIGAEDTVNLSFPGIRIILIVEICLMQDNLGAFGFDQIQNRASIRPQSLIANKSDLKIGRRLCCQLPLKINPRRGNTTKTTVNQ
jgi:hypothetical protein